MVFVEVKTREDRAFGEAAEAVTMPKQRRIVLAALDYLMRHGQAASASRFDVVSIQFGAGHPDIEVYQNAFDAPRTFNL